VISGAEHPSHLDDGLARRRADLAEQAARTLGVGVEHLFRGAGLHRDDAERVRDDVVQLAGDAQTLRRRGLVGCPGALLLEPLRVPFELLVPLLPCARREPERPGPGHERDVEDEVDDAGTGAREPVRTDPCDEDGDREDRALERQVARSRVREEKCAAARRHFGRRREP